MQKLTLSAEPEVIHMAKQLAGQRGTSVSDLFSQFVRSMVEPRHASKTAHKTKMATGLVTWPRGKTPRRLIEEAMAERYLR